MLCAVLLSYKMKGVHGSVKVIYDDLSPDWRVYHCIEEREPKNNNKFQSISQLVLLGGIPRRASGLE